MKRALKTGLLISLVFSLNACEEAPLNPVSSSQGLSAQSLSSRSLRLQILVQASATSSWSQPLTLQQIEAIKVGHYTIPLSQIQSSLKPASLQTASPLPASPAPAVTSAQEQQARNQALQQQRAEILKQQAAEAEQRRLQAAETRTRQQTEQQEKLATQSFKKGFKSQAETAADMAAPAPAPEQAPYRLTYLGTGLFLVESSQPVSGPLTLEFQLKGFNQAATIPWLPQPGSLPLMLKIARDPAGQTLVTGNLNQRAAVRSFAVSPQADGSPQMSWTSSDGSSQTLDLGQLQQPQELDSQDQAFEDSASVTQPHDQQTAPEQDPIAQAWAEMEQTFASSENPNDNDWNSGWSDNDGWADSNWPDQPSEDSSQAAAETSGDSSSDWD